MICILVVIGAVDGHPHEYNWFGLLQVFIIGLLLSWIRWRSGSTLLTMVLHAIANF